MTLPVVVTVTSGGVSITHPNGTVAMSRFSERAKRLTLDLGLGVHRINAATDLDDLTASTLADLIVATA